MLIKLNSLMKRRRRGWDLLQLGMWISCVAIIIWILAPKYLDSQNATRRGATEQEMKILAEQCALYASRSADGKPPATLGNLVTGLSDTETNDGNSYGNFLASKKVTSNGSSFVDKWKNTYVYDSSARTITSTAGGGTAIVMPF